MFQRDFVARQIEQLSQALARVLLNKEQQQYQEALSEIDQTGQEYLGLRPGEMKAITYHNLRTVLTQEDRFDAERASFVAELLRQQGDVLFIQEGDDEAAHASFQQALHLYLDVFFHATKFQSPDNIARIDDLVSRVDVYSLETDALKRLFRYYENVARYGKAEDTLFILADRPDEDCFEEGLAFFERMLKTTLPRLSRGGLPYKEVVEGLNAFKEKQRGSL